MWNDIDLYHAIHDFTSDPTSFSGDEVRAFIGELVRHLYPRNIWKDSLLITFETDGK